MEKVLLREESPLDGSQWEKVDETVAKVAKSILVGRRFIKLYGPLGFGAYTVPLYSYSTDGPVRAQITAQLPLKMISKDFVITMKDLEGFNAGQPFDLAPVAAAASMCAFEEDELIFLGDEDAGLEGLLNANGRATAPLSDWSEEGRALGDISAAVAKLTAAGFYGPFAVVVNPMRYSQLQRVHGRRGIMESELIEKRSGAGLYQSPAVPENKVLVIAPQPQYVDIAIGQDLITAYVETAEMEHRFRVFETLALRIKQPGAICTLE